MYIIYVIYYYIMLYILLYIYILYIFIYYIYTHPLTPIALFSRMLAPIVAGTL